MFYSVFQLAAGLSTFVHFFLIIFYVFHALQHERRLETHKAELQHVSAERVDHSSGGGNIFGNVRNADLPLPAHILLNKQCGDSFETSSVTPVTSRAMATTATRTTLQAKTYAMPNATCDGVESVSNSTTKSALMPMFSQARPQSFMQKQQKKRQERVRFPIHFAFQEGFTNAVRRPVYIKDLLLLPDHNRDNIVSGAPASTAI